jgi:hypothetical protein
MSKYQDKHVVFCEGSTDIEFFTTLLSYRLSLEKDDLKDQATIEADPLFNQQLEEIMFVDGEGDNLRNVLIEDLLKSLENQTPKSITIIVDGDNKLNQKIKYFKKTFNKATSYQNPENMLTFGELDEYNWYTVKKGELIQKRLQMGVFTVQGKDFKDLETLCLKIATHLSNPKYQAVLDGFEENCNNLPQKPKSLDKAKAQVYLASMEQWCDCKFSAGLNKGYLDKDHEVLSFLDPIVEVLKTS